MIRAYKEDDYEEIMTWLDKRGMSRIDQGVLSNTGLIIPGVACIFLYHTNSKVCLIENLFTNPEVKDRKKSIIELLDHAYKIASDWGFKYIQSVTDNKAIIEYAVLFGGKFEHNKTLITIQGGRNGRNRISTTSSNGSSSTDK